MQFFKKVAGKNKFIFIFRQNT